MKTGGTLSVWFLIGISLAGNGLLIFAAGIYALVSPPAHPLILYRLHADVWWGGLLLIVGVFFCFRFSPARQPKLTAGN